MGPNLGHQDYNYCVNCVYGYSRARDIGIYINSFEAGTLLLSMEGKLDVVFDVGTSQFNLRQFLSRISSSSPVRNELKDHILRLMFEESDEHKPVIVSQEMSKFQFLVMVFNQFNCKHVSIILLL